MRSFPADRWRTGHGDREKPWDGLLVVAFFNARRAVGGEWAVPGSCHGGPVFEAAPTGFRLDGSACRVLTSCSCNERVFVRRRWRRAAGLGVGVGWVGHYPSSLLLPWPRARPGTSRRRSPPACARCAFLGACVPQPARPVTLAAFPCLVSLELSRPLNDQAAATYFFGFVSSPYGERTDPYGGVRLRGGRLGNDSLSLPFPWRPAGLGCLSCVTAERGSPYAVSEGLGPRSSPG